MAHKTKKMLIGVCDPPPAEISKVGSSDVVAEEIQPEDFGVPDLPVIRRPKTFTIRGRDLWARTKSATFDGIYVLMYPNNNRNKRASLPPLIKEEKKR